MGIMPIERKRSAVEDSTQEQSRNDRLIHVDMSLNSYMQVPDERITPRNMLINRLYNTQTDGE